MDNSQANPYVGPRPFEEKDRYFFGREREARDLLAFVISEPLVLFYAQSGAGKSSIVNTSLIPGLRKEEFTVLPIGRVGGELPDNIGSVRNIYTFNLLSNLEQEADPSGFTQLLLTDYLAQLGEKNGRKPTILIIDQFEEIITTHAGRWRDREDFFWQLQGAFQNEPWLWVVLTMREDHIAALDPFAEILPDRLRARFHMQHLNVEAAQTAIEEPAKQAGKPFERGVASMLVRNLSQIREIDRSTSTYLYGEYVEPVQLQVVCYQLWENLKTHHSSVITVNDLQTVGDVDRALAAFYNEAIADVVEGKLVSEIDLRNWFNQRLITEAHTRGTVYQGAEKTAGLQNEVVNQLANRYLLRADRRAGGVWYEIVHDRFIPPILQANQTWRQQQSALVQAAITWSESGRSTSKLFLGEQLKDTLENANWRTLEPVVIEFLKECGRVNQTIIEKEVLRRQELEQAQKLALEQEQRADTEARHAKRLRALVIAVGVISLIALLLLGFALVTRQSAIVAARLARENEGRALEAEVEAQNVAAIAAKALMDEEISNATAIAAVGTSEYQQRELELKSTEISSEATRSGNLSNELVTRNAIMGATATVIVATQTVLEETIILDIPYLSQSAPTAARYERDGSLTALAMILNADPNNGRVVTTDMLYDLYRPATVTGIIDFQAIQIIAGNENLQLIHEQAWPQSPSPLDNLKAKLRENKPVMVLVDHLNLRNTGSNYDRGNFLVVIGFDYDHVYVHDPSPNGLGCYRKLTNEQFVTAWSSTSDLNEGRQSTGLVSENKLFTRLPTLPSGC